MAKNDEFTYFEMVYYGLDRSDRKRHSGYNKGSEKNVDRDIRICPECDKVYEVYGVGQGVYNQFNYVNFPRFGKLKEKCANCREENGEKTFIVWHRSSASTHPMSMFRSGYKKVRLNNKKRSENG
jgi:hypothetical protein